MGVIAVLKMLVFVVVVCYMRLRNGLLVAHLLGVAASVRSASGDTNWGHLFFIMFSKCFCS